MNICISFIFAKKMNNINLSILLAWLKYNPLIHKLVFSNLYIYIKSNFQHLSRLHIHHWNLYTKKTLSFFLLPLARIISNAKCNRFLPIFYEFSNIPYAFVAAPTRRFATGVISGSQSLVFIINKTSGLVWRMSSKLGFPKNKTSLDRFSYKQHPKST